MTTKNEKTAMKLFRYGYVDSIISARAELPMAKVQELRLLYNLLKAKKDVKKEK